MKSIASAVLRRSLLVVSLLVALASVARPDSPTFDVNDISILWPAPKTSADVDALLSADEGLADGSTIWPKDVFDHVMAAAPGVKMTASSGTPFQIRTSDPKFLAVHTWKVVGIRVDPSAPGADSATIARFGSFPQLRLVMQPVTAGLGAVRVHDVAAHLVYTFASFEPCPGCPLGVKGIPDKVAFRRVLDDLNALKVMSTTGQAPTSGDLSIHPALSGRVAGFQDRLKLLLRTNLSRAQLQAVSYMGIDTPEPWIFFSMAVPPRRTDPLPPASRLEMFTQRGGDAVVTSQRNSQFGNAGGVSTADLFAGDIRGRLDHRVFPNATDPSVQGVKFAHIADIVANPRRSHFFNTNCVSCHSESSRRRDLALAAAPAPLSYQRPTGISGIASSLLPKDTWNVRNFGWFPDFFTGNVVETVSQRTANEAADSVDFINREYFGHAGAASAPVPPPPPPPPAPPAPITAMKASPLTLLMDIKSPDDFEALKALLNRLQSAPPDQNPIRVALERLGTVHFARFFFIGKDKLAVVTSYDGPFDRYIEGFVGAIGEIFDALLGHMKDAPPLPVRDHRTEFLAYVQNHDLKCIEPFYSAYPDLSTQDILTLRNRSRP